MINIDFKEHRKLRIRNLDESFDKHEVIKLLVMLMSGRKHKKAGIYSEYSLTNGDLPDVVVDLGKEIIIYEIQKSITKKWVDSIVDRDLDLGLSTIIIPVDKISDDINEMKKQLKEYIA